MTLVLSLLRISMGWIFLWAFLDKIFGLGFTTKPAQSWLTGVSPTTGFLKFGTDGPLKPFFESLAGNSAIDWLFMLGLLGIGSALILGIGMRIAVHTGSLLLLLMYLSLFPPEHNPILDEHIMYILVLLVLNQKNAGVYFGFGHWWSKTKLVKNFPILK